MINPSASKRSLPSIRLSLRKMKSVLPSLCLLLLSPITPAADVFEANLGRETELPGGKEADGIRGDFILRSDKIEAVISGNQPNRRANMSTFYGADGISPGCLYDLTLRGTANDQLVAYAPCGHGPVAYVRILPSQDPSEAAVESVTTSASNGGLYKRNEYRAKDGLQGLIITTTLRNDTDKPLKAATKSDLTRFESTGTTVGSIAWYDAINPAHKCGYALATTSLSGTDKLPDTLELAPKQEIIITRFFAVGTSPAQAVGEALAAQGVAVYKEPISVRTNDGSKLGSPITTATISVRFGSDFVPAYPDSEGKVTLKLPTGPGLVRYTDFGRRLLTVSFNVANSDGPPSIAWMTNESGVRFAITDESGKPIPCKAHLEPLDEGAPKLNLGPKWRAHGCVDQYQSENGHFTLGLQPGRYRIVVVRGPEYSHLVKEVTIVPEKLVEFTGTLKRLVNTTGWISSDFHNHSTPSGDNVCDTDGRLINIAAEHLEFTPTTEHNRLFDWEPIIKSLGLAPFIKTVKGIELTGSRQHFNAFPFEPDPLLQDGGAPIWNDDPRITALTLRRWQGERADRWIQFNHPDLSNMFIDRDGDGIADGGFVGVGTMIDGSEAQNGPGTDILHDAPFRVSRKPGALAAKASTVREFVWKQLLNQGHRIVAVGVADAHSVYGNGVGCWRTYLPSSTDDPAQINWAELAPRAKAGNIILSTGPFLEVTTPDGKIAGDDVRATGSIDLKVRVQCTDWIDINRVQLLVNSRPHPGFNFTRATHPKMFQDGVVKFDQTLKIPLQEDAHLIVVALHETGNMKTGFGTSDYATMRPCAYNNPIYVDADGGGFKPNGDTLDYDLPTMGATADKARAILEAK
jgi:hypothetical protein